MAEDNVNKEVVDPLAREEKSLREYFLPVTSNHPSCIVLPQTRATHFELKPSVIQLIPSFHGLDREDPYMHVKEFLDICTTFRFQNFSDESVRLRLFPFSLKDRAKAWLNSLPSNSITSWDQLISKFLSKFFPMSKTNALRREIADFRQTEDEQFYMCWERFKDLLLRCPHHGFELWRLVQYFYNALTMSNRHMIESMNRGEFLNLSSTDAWQFLETLSENSQQWDFSNEREKPRKGGLYEVRDDFDVKNALGNLTKKVEALALSQTMNSAMSVRNEGCTSFVNPPYTPQESYVDQANALNSYGRSADSPFSTTYNPNWRNHPNFSWRQNQPPMNYGGQQFAAPNPSHPPGFQSQPQFAAPQRKPSIEDTLQQFMQTTQQSILKLETQVGQLAMVISEREREREAT